MHSYLTYMCPQYVTFGLIETAYHITVFCLFVCLFFKAQNNVISVFDGFRDLLIISQQGTFCAKSLSGLCVYVQCEREI